MTTIIKLCRRCDTEQPIASFSQDRNRRDGLNPYCRRCNSDGMKKWRAANLERAKVSARRWKLAHDFGITPDDYARMLDEQLGGCAICGIAEAEATGGVLMVDHNHETGAVRGLLCRRCNLGVGYFQDDPACLAAASTYLEAQP